MTLATALDLVQIILAVLLIALVLLQSKGSGLGGIFGQDTGSVYRTRRGVERRLYQLTIIAAVSFFLVALISSLIKR